MSRAPRRRWWMAAGTLVAVLAASLAAITLYRDRAAALEHAGSVHYQELAAGGRSLRYRLFVPPASEHGPQPLLVLLHGCAQTADDIALTTDVERLASQFLR